MAHFDDGTQKYCGDVSVREAIETVRSESEVGEYEARLQRWVETGSPQ